MKNYISIFILLFLSIAGLAQRPRQVLDLTAGSASSFTDEADRLLGSISGDRILFWLSNPASKQELWVSNGTAQGTQKLQDFSGTDLIKTFSYSGSMLFILYRNDAHEVWYSDGSLAGTKMLYLAPNYLQYTVLFKDALYYATRVPDFFGSTRGLYKFPLQGAAAYKPVKIYEFEPALQGIAQLATTQDQIIGIGGVKDKGQQLFVSDGSTQGTKPIYQLAPAGPANLSDPVYNRALGNKLFFFYQTKTYNALYITTSTGTKLLGQYRSQIFGKNYETRRAFFTWNGQFYFSGDTLSNASFTKELLHVSDGTPAGTHQLKINPLNVSRPEWFTPYGGKLYFKAYGSFDIEYLCVTQGTANTSFQAIDQDILGAGATFGGDDMVVFHDSLFFNAYRRETGIELWHSNGFTQGTKQHDLFPGSGDSWPQQLTVAGSKLFFTAISSQGRELWVYNPTEKVTATQDLQQLAAQIKIWPNPASSNIQVWVEAQQGLQKMTLINILGQVMYQKTVSGNTLSENIAVEGWPKGWYLLDIQGSNGTRKVEKILVE